MIARTEPQSMYETTWGLESMGLCGDGAGHAEPAAILGGPKDIQLPSDGVGKRVRFGRAWSASWSVGRKDLRNGEAIVPRQP